MAVVVSNEVMRRSDAAAIAGGIDSRELMYRAGVGIYESAEWKAPVGIICGKGNNAGDGYVVAVLLHMAGISAEIVLTTDSFSPDGQYYFDRCAALGIPVKHYSPDMDFRCYASLLDCLLGTGFRGELRGSMGEVIRKINESGAYVVSADINSGLNGDTGTGSLFVKSDLTVSIGTFKYGHFLGRAGEAMKAKVNCDIGIPIVGSWEEISE